MFIAALFIIVKTWKQPNYAWTYEWIKMWYKYTKKKNQIMPFAATCLDLEIIIISEVRHRKTNIICYHLYVKSKKVIQMNLSVKQKQTHRKQNFGYQRGGGEG